MKEFTSRFYAFRLSDADAASLEEDFLLLIRGAELRKTPTVAAVLARHRGAHGVYFWVMRYQQAGYKIYIGQTNSLQYRILNYISEFQPHAPNDYKLRIFEAFMIELVPGATLDLHFREVDCRGLEKREAKARLNLVEGEAIRKYDPLLNNLKPPTPEAREELKKAFGLYYRSAFESKLRT